MNTDDTRRYDDMIGLPHHVSKTRPHMPIGDRAAQFAPFAALTGYGDAVNETARLAEQRAELDEDRKAEIDAALRKLAQCADEEPEAAVTYFMPDGRKAGGSYVTVRGRVRRADTARRVLIFRGGTEVPFDDIYGIDDVDGTKPN